MEFNIVSYQKLIWSVACFVGGVSVSAICECLLSVWCVLQVLIQFMNVHSYGQEVVLSVAFFVSIAQCLGHVLAFVQWLFSIGWFSIAFAEVIWLWPAVFLVTSCIVIPCVCSVFITLLVWCLWVQFLKLSGSWCSLPIPPK